MQMVNIFDHVLFALSCCCVPNTKSGLAPFKETVLPGVKTQLLSSHYAIKVNEDNQMCLYTYRE